MRVDILLACLPALALAAPTKRAPLHIPRDVELIKGKYIVKMKTPEVGVASVKVSSKIDKCVKSISADADFVYDTVGGFASSLTDAEVEALRDNPDVEYIEQDFVQEMFATVSQTSAPWGLARLSGARGSTTYRYDDTAGAGTCSYVIDTGVQGDHPEFEGRAQQVANFISSATTDDQGHGTHVAGTIGSKTFGVAKKTQIYAVKVLAADGRGTNSASIAGMNFVITDSRTRSCPRGVVVNMSLGGPASQTVNSAAAAIVNANIFLAVAAGNGDLQGRPVNINTVSPASETSACTVGATDINDRVASFSNFGALLDVYAPGVNIASTYPGSRTNVALSGTSMASPHVAGLAAYYLGLGSATAANMCNFLVSTGLRNVITGVPSGTANVLVQNGLA